jgi:hypothetical protein
MSATKTVREHVFVIDVNDFGTWPVPDLVAYVTGECADEENDELAFTARRARRTLRKLDNGSKYRKWCKRHVNTWSDNVIQPFHTPGIFNDGSGNLFRDGEEKSPAVAERHCATLTTHYEREARFADENATQSTSDAEAASWRAAAGRARADLAQRLEKGPEKFPVALSGAVRCDRPPPQ